MKPCSVCSKPAVYHVTLLKNGDVNELHLCETHFHDYMQKPDNEESTESFIESLLPESEMDERRQQDEELVCPNCGITYREFRERGRFGCPYDYEAFRERLVPLLTNIHNATQHTGKVPRRAPMTSENQLKLIQLRRELSVAIDQEDYEEAARLRDEIRTLEGELGQA